MSVKDETKIKKYEMVPPDGGWGYVIILAAVINMVAITIYGLNFGMIFRDIFIELRMESTSSTLLHGVSSFNVAVGGFFTNSMLKFLSIRQLGLLSAFIYNLGLLGIVFVKSKITFFLCYGLLQGLGHGIMFNLSQTAIQNYFLEKRLLAVSIMQTLVGVLSLFFPLFIKWSLEKYEFRGTQLLITGISMNTIVAMTLFQPVAWYMKKVKISEDKENEMKSLMAEAKQVDLASSIKTTTSQSNATKDEKEKEQKRNRINVHISKVIDLSEYKSFLLSNASIGVALSVFTDITFTVMLPQALYSMGWNEGNVAWASTLNSAGDLLTRFFFMAASKWLKKVNSHVMYLIGLVIALVSRLGMLGTNNMIVMTAFITMMGVSRCFIMLLLPVVIVDAVGEEKFTSALGVFMFVFGCFNLILGPAVGGIRDLTNSYPTAFYVLISCFGIVIMFWSIELLYKSNKHKRQLRKAYAKA